MSNSSNTIQQPPRGGSVLICVLACLVVVAGIVTATRQTALQSRRAMRTQHQLRQTELLLTAGIQRATKQLQADAEYTGETWQLSDKTIPGIATAEVLIAVAPSSRQDGKEDATLEVNVTAMLKTSEQTALRRSHRFAYEP